MECVWVCGKKGQARGRRAPLQIELKRARLKENEGRFFFFAAPPPARFLSEKQGRHFSGFFGFAHTATPQGKKKRHNTPPPLNKKCKRKIRRRRPPRD
jgi:hypothetical protein